MTGPAGRPGRPFDDDERLLSLLYQFPVGVVVCDDDGVVELVNPAAARMLVPALPAGSDLSQLFPLLGRIAPELVDAITGDPTRLGRLDSGRRVIVPAGNGRQEWREIMTTRVDVGRLLITVLDVTVERQLAAREHEIAVELQGAMLGRVDPVPGLPVGVVYRAAAEQMAIGGDWYDVVDLPGDRVAFVVGDVCGHNLQATVVMGQLRSAVRAIAASCNGPAELLARAGQFALGVEGAACSTVVCAFLDRGTGRLTYSCAGHVPPLLVRTGAEPRFLMRGRHPPLACPTRLRPIGAVEQLLAGDVVVFYTDGLVERREEELDAGLERLRAAAASLAGLDPVDLGAALAQSVLGAASPEDDVCVVTTRYEPSAARRQSRVTVNLEPNGAP